MSATIGKTVLARKRLTVSDASKTTRTILRFSRADARRLHGRKPVVEATWRSNRVTGAKTAAKTRGVSLAGRPTEGGINVI